MFSSWTLLLVAGLYVGLLFVVALWGEQGARPRWLERLRPAIYALALAVYCSSWTFHGAVGTAVTHGWGFLPIYLGPILMMLLGWRLLERLVAISNEQRIVSIADFLSSRYGRVPGLAALVASLALLAALPYLGLQYRAVAMSVEVLTQAGSGADTAIWKDPALYVALSLALFAILFGTRRSDATEHHRGLVLAVALESLLKLLAFMLLGVFALWHLPGGESLWQQMAHSARQMASQSWPGSMLMQTLLAFLALLCLPRQFHVAVVECKQVEDLRPARWLFAGYLVLFSLMVIPQSQMGQSLFAGMGFAPDSYVLRLPMHFDSEVLTLAAFLGGFSAATGMAIMASVALATMVSNDLVMPVWLRWRAGSPRQAIASQVLWVRRLTILVLALLGFAYHRAVLGHGDLAEHGLLALAAVAQFAPALVGGLFWRGASRQGAWAGTLLGAVLWGYTLLLPALVHAGWLNWHDWLANGPLGIAALRPEHLFGLQGWDALSHGAFWSLLGNVMAFVLVSLRWRPRLREQLIAAAFINPETMAADMRQPSGEGQGIANLQGRDLAVLAERIVGADSARRAFADYRDAAGQPWQPDASVDRVLMQFTERLLASAIGADSARLILTSALRGSGLALGEVANVLDEAGQAMRFNREVMEATLDNLSQAVSVIDAELRLVAWNPQYRDMFGYPDHLLYVGCPIADLIRWNAEHGEMGEGDADTFIQRRIAHLAAGTPHIFERVRSSGQVIEMRGRPLPGGGYVTTFSDVTAYKLVEGALREANETLEQRVAERSREVESAQQAKNRFLAAVSHDLLQPLNAARLFASALRESQSAQEQQHLAERVDASLRAAEDLLDGLLDISRLDAQALQPEVGVFDVSELLDELAAQYAPVAQKRGLELIVRARAGLHVRSDRRLLRRALQNFVANAMRYTRDGRVMLVARPTRDSIRLQVRDSGSGIHPHHLDQIFEEFRRFAPPGQSEHGLGLGLSICQRIARTLEHPLEVHSRIGQGSVFGIRVPRVAAPILAVAQASEPRSSGGQSLAGLKVLCIDNAPDILEGMRSLLGRWQVDVSTAQDVACAGRMQQQHAPDVLLVDYHLHQALDGLALIAHLREQAGRPLAAALLTGDGREAVKQACRKQDVVLLTKPIKPASLRAFLAAVR